MLKLLSILILLTIIKAEDIPALCWTNTGGNGIPCKERTEDKQLWLATTATWTDRYVISDRTNINGIDYLLILEKNR